MGAVSQCSKISRSLAVKLLFRDEPMRMSFLECPSMEPEKERHGWDKTFGGEMRVSLVLSFTVP